MPTRYREDEWAARLEEYCQSGLRVKEFASSGQLKPSVFSLPSVQSRSIGYASASQHCLRERKTHAPTGLNSGASLEHRRRAKKRTKRLNVVRRPPAFIA